MPAGYHDERRLGPGDGVCQEEKRTLGRLGVLFAVMSFDRQAIKRIATKAIKLQAPLMVFLQENPEVRSKPNLLSHVWCRL